MSQSKSKRAWDGIAKMAMLSCVGLGLIGCEADDYMNPSTVGRWERTPVSMPILETLDLAGTVTDDPVVTSPVRPEDLQPDVQEYVIGAGDFLTVSIFELISVGVTDVQNRAVDETGFIRLPVVGKVKASGFSPSQLEEEIIDILEEKGVMQNATVSVVVQQSRQNLYTIIGAPEEGSTRFGPYLIPQPDFRLLQAIAQAGGVSNRIKRILVFRQASLTSGAAGESQTPATRPVRPAPSDAGDLIDNMMNQGTQPADLSEGAQPADRPAAPSGVEAGLDSNTGGSPKWVYVDGKFVRVEGTGGGTASRASRTAANNQELSKLVAQRILEVPYDKLINGDMRYNIVIRPGDVIRIPNQEAGFVYIMGQTNRPGAYTVPGDQDLTLKQLIASSGGLGQLAWPERVDLTRRIGNSNEATVRLNLRAIFDGTEPDIFLKPDDLINVGSSGLATPLAVIRNGFRFTYGFGFVLDRNFDDEVFGDRNDNN